MADNNIDLIVTIRAQTEGLIAALKEVQAAIVSVGRTVTEISQKTIAGIKAETDTIVRSYSERINALNAWYEKSKQSITDTFGASPTGSNARKAQAAQDVLDEEYTARVLELDKERAASAKKSSEEIALARIESAKRSALATNAEQQKIAESTKNYVQLANLRKEASLIELDARKKAFEETEGKAVDVSAGVAQLRQINAKRKEFADAEKQILDQHNKDMIDATMQAKTDQNNVLMASYAEQIKWAEATGDRIAMAEASTNARRVQAQIDLDNKLAIIKKSGASPEQMARQEQQARLEYSRQVASAELALTKQTIKQDLAERVRGINDRLKLARQARDTIAVAQLEEEKLLATTAARRKEIEAIIDHNLALGKNTDALRREQSALDEQERQIKENSKVAQQYAASIKLEGAIQSLDQAALKVAAFGAVVTAAFSAALKPAMDLEKALAAVSAVSQIPMKSPYMEELKQQAIELGSQFIYTSAEIASGMKNLSQAGFEVPEIKMMTKDILDLAMAADMPLKDAFNIAATTIRAFNMNVSDTTKIVNTLTTTANATNVEVADLAESFKYAGPVAAAAGIEFNEVAAALGIMANAGIKASMGGTAMRQSVSALIAPTSNQRRIMAELGFDVRKADGNMKGFIETVGDLERIFRDQLPDSADKAGLAMKLFGDRAGPGMLALINEGAFGLADLTSKLDEAETKGAAADVAKQRMENLTDSITKWKQALAGLNITILYDLLGVLRIIVDWTAKAVNGFRDFITEYPAIGKIVTILSAIVGVLGLVTTGLAAAALVIGGFSLALLTLQRQGPAISSFFNILRGGLTTVTISANGATVALTGFARAVGVVTRILGWVGIIATLGMLFFGLKDNIKDSAWFINKFGKDVENSKGMTESVTQAYVSMSKSLEEVKRRAEDAGVSVEDLNKVKLPTPKSLGFKDGVEQFEAPSFDTLVKSMEGLQGLLLDTIAKAEELAKIEDISNEEYVKRFTYLSKIFSLQRDAYKTLEPVIQAQLKAEEERKKINEDLLKIVTDPTKKAAYENEAKAIDRNITFLKTFTKELEELTKANLNYKLVDERVRDGLELTLKKYAELNKRAKERVELIERQNEAVSLLEEVTNTSLTEEELQQRRLNREYEAKTKLLQQLANEEDLLARKARQFYEEQMMGSEGVMRQTRNMTGVISQYGDKVAAVKKIGEAGEPTAAAAGNEATALKEKLRVTAEQLMQSEEAALNTMKSIIEELYSFKMKKYASDYAAAKKYKEALARLEEDQANHAFAVQKALSTRTIALDIEEQRVKVEAARREVEFQKTQGSPREQIKAEQELLKALNAQTLAHANALGEIGKQMPYKEYERYLDALGAANPALKQITESVRRNQEASRDEAKNLSDASDRAKQYGNELKTSWSEASVVAENLARKQEKFRQAASNSADANLKEAKSLEAQLQALDTKLNQYKDIFEKFDAEDKYVRFYVDASFDEVTTKWQATYDKMVTDGTKGVKMYIFPEYGPGVDQFMANLKLNVKDVFRAALQEVAQATSTKQAGLGLPFDKKARGGAIPGFGGGDIVPTYLEPGEFVMRKEAVARYGSAFMSMLNDSMVPATRSTLARLGATPRLAMASGGEVGPLHRLAITVQNKTFEVQGQKAQINGLMQALKRERLTKLGV